MSVSSKGNGRDAPSGSTVSGTVRFGDLTPAIGMTIQVFAKSLRREARLAEGRTDRSGHYLIEYRAKSGARGGEDGLNLVVKAMGPDGSVLVASNILFEAGPNAVIDLVISTNQGSQASLFERLEAAVAPHLGGVTPDDLEDRDLDYLGGQTGHAGREIARFALAHRLVGGHEPSRPRAASRSPVVRSEGLPAPFWFALLAGAPFTGDEAPSLDQGEADFRKAVPRLGAAAVRKALTSAIGNNDIPSAPAKRVDIWIEAFQKLAAHQILGSKEAPTLAGSALDEAKVSSEDERLRVAGLLREKATLDPALISELEGFLGQRQIDSLRISFSLADLTGGDFSVVAVLRQEFKLKRPDQIRNLAKLSESDWVALIERRQGEMNLPASTMDSGVPSPSSASLFGATLARRVREAYPTAAFAGGLERTGNASPFAFGSIFSKIIEKNPDFDLGRTAIDAFLDGDGGAGLGAVARNSAFRTELKAAQRLFKFAPSFEATAALLEDGIHSAQGAYRLGESAFVRRYTDRAGLSESEAHAAWRRAADTVAASLTIVGELAALDPAHLPAALGAANANVLANFPNWENLFRAGDCCDCQHCRSVLGPAAYLADLLMYLRARQRNAGFDPTASVASLLHKRRPELGYIELNCANALTAIPYVDIVCEILEAAIAGEEADVELSGFTAMPGNPANARTAVAQAFAAVPLDAGGAFTLSQVSAADPDRWMVHGEAATFLLKKKPPSANFFAQILPNTHADSITLRAYPAHLNSHAYEKLRLARHPFRLPFDLYFEEVAAGFLKARVDRSELMRLFAAPAGAMDADIAATALGIACGGGGELEFITIADPSDPGQQAFWGETNNANWLDALSVVETFLVKTRLDYNQMLALFDCRFVDPSDSIAIIDDGSCDAANFHIEGMDAASLDRIHRFLRLWRKLPGWAMWELDLAIGSPSIGAGVIDAACLVRLADLLRLRSRLGGRVQVEELCALFDGLNISRHFVTAEQQGEGLYERLFLDMRKTQPLDPAFAVAVVTSASSELIADHAPGVLAALGLKPTQLETMLDMRDVNGDPLNDGKLTLSNLSFLWRHNFLAKRLKLDAIAWQVVLMLLEDEGGPFADPAAALAFLERVGGLLAIGVKPDELAWLLLADRSAKAATPERSTARFLEGLWTAILKARSEHIANQRALEEAASDPAKLEALLLGLLQKLGRTEAEAQFVLDCLQDDVRQQQLVSGLASGFAFPATVTSEIRIRYDEPAHTLDLTGVLSDTQKTELLTVAGTTGNSSYQDAIEALHAAPTHALAFFHPSWPLADHCIDNLVAAASKALDDLLKASVEQTILERTSSHLGLADELTRRLASYPVLSPKSLLEHLAGDFADTERPFTRVDRPVTFEAVEWAQRLAKLWLKWKLTADDLERMAHLLQASGLPTFDAFPLTSADDAFPILIVTGIDALLHFRAASMGGDLPFLQLLVEWKEGNYPIANSFAAAIAEAQGAWLSTEVEAMLGKLDPALQDDYLQPETWERFARAMSLAAKLNARADELVTLASPAVGEGHVRLIRDLLQARIGEEAWALLSVEIQDVLRARKRDALADYLLAQAAPAYAPTGKWQNTNDLYAYYLLDVEMGACMLTSRIVQATNSIQLFVNRCFMGLEPEVAIAAEGSDGDSAWRWWPWMHKYRLWEANVKVFLWPENWIEPELKRDRSEIFKQMESELLQGEVDNASAEAAFAKYLDALDKVAQLEVIGLHQEDEGEDTNVHVFARTPGAEPHQLYYRTFDFQRWTPWAKVDVDVPTDSLTPIVLNGRPFLFWPVFTEANDESGNSSVTLPSSGSSSAAVPQAAKRLSMRFAVSDCRLGQWSTPRISKRGFEAQQPHRGDIRHRYYRFYVLDRNSLDGRTYIKFDGFSVTRGGLPTADLSGAFDIAGCTGAPEPATVGGQFFPVVRPEVYSTGYWPQFGRYLELGETGHFINLLARLDYPQTDFTVENGWSSVSAKYTLVLNQTPGLFRVTTGWHQSYVDRIGQDGLFALAQSMGRRNEPFPTGFGSWLPYFYADKSRTFFILPALAHVAIDREPTAGAPSYYPDLKRRLKEQENAYRAQLTAWVAAFDLSSLTLAQRSALETALYTQAAGETTPPFTDENLRERMIAALMRIAKLQLFGSTQQNLPSIRYHFLSFYHPFVCDFAKLIHDPRLGIPALMRRDLQFKITSFSFSHVYWPSMVVLDPSIEDPTLPPWAVTAGYPKETVDFSSWGAYSSYNWELFFHAPLLIANALSRNQKFEQARNWYHFIFNPLGVDGPGTAASPVSWYWITKPFYETSHQTYLQQRIETLLGMLAGDPNVPGASAQARDQLAAQVKDWRAHPYEPHRIAAYRTVAYQKNVVMKYLDNLLAWGDQLFRQDSMESVAEATQLYIMAAELLGPRPRPIPKQGRPAAEGFFELENQLDAMSNAFVEIENLVPPAPGSGAPGQNDAPLPSLYFCIPNNDRLLGYWDRVADRLYKIRHCLNIDGVARQLALFALPIDPRLLVKAAAAGLDIGVALGEISAPLPIYRFSVILQKANELCADVKALGAALLAALEKKDAEDLALLRQSHELRALQALREIHEHQIGEARESLQSLKQSMAAAEVRRDFYRDVDKISGWEEAARLAYGAGIVREFLAIAAHQSAAVAHIIPQWLIGGAGAGGSPVAASMAGGEQAAGASSAWAAALGGLAGISYSFSSLASMQAGYERRWDDWKLQEKIADKEILSLERQLLGAELRLSIAEKQLENLEAQIEDAEGLDAFMRSKYTNQELYQWYVGQISGTYFATYQLAHDFAKRAERCYRFELGLLDSSIISASGYWDNLKKGLLAGEALQLDLRRLESAYLERNRRPFELTKHVSLVQLSPMAWIELRETGRCRISVPEELFDLDYPGHYFRVIEAMSVTIPAVAGPGTTIPCTLRLLRSTTRVSSDVSGGYARAMDEDGNPADDARFVEASVPVTAIAASSGQNDTGLFEFSFRDERYLPFEGAGAASEWSIELFHDPDPASLDMGKALRQFDYDAISDVILHINYSAREDAGEFKQAAVAHLRDYFSNPDPVPTAIVFDLRRQFASQWSRFLNPPDPAAGYRFELKLSPNHFPMRDSGQQLVLASAILIAKSGLDDLVGSMDIDAQSNIPIALGKALGLGDLLIGKTDLAGLGLELGPDGPPVQWLISLPRDVQDLLLVVNYYRAS